MKILVTWFEGNYLVSITDHNTKEEAEKNLEWQQEERVIDFFLFELSDTLNPEKETVNEGFDIIESLALVDGVCQIIDGMLTKAYQKGVEQGRKE